VIRVAPRPEQKDPVNSPAPPFPDEYGRAVDVRDRDEGMFSNRSTRGSPIRAPVEEMTAFSADALGGRGIRATRRRGTGPERSDRRDGGQQKRSATEHQRSCR
jgi:hypothetical protein